MLKTLAVPHISHRGSITISIAQSLGLVYLVVYTVGLGLGAHSHLGCLFKEIEEVPLLLQLTVLVPEK